MFVHNYEIVLDKFEKGCIVLVDLTYPNLYISDLLDTKQCFVSSKSLQRAKRVVILMQQSPWSVVIRVAFYGK